MLRPYGGRAATGCKPKNGVVGLTGHLGSPTMGGEKGHSH